MLIERIDVNFECEENRGKLVQLVRRGYSQVNVVTSKRGVFRGGHYHKYNTEAYYIIKGKCKVTARCENEQESGIYSEGDFFRVGPYISHDFDYLEDTIMVTMYSHGVEMEDGSMDIFSH